MIVHIDRLIRHLQTQIDVAERMKSDFVYITKNEALKCLELAQAEDVIMDILNGRKEANEEDTKTTAEP